MGDTPPWPLHTCTCCVGGWLLIAGMIVLLLAFVVMCTSLDIFSGRKVRQAIRGRRSIEWCDPQTWMESKAHGRPLGCRRHRLPRLGYRPDVPVPRCCFRDFGRFCCASSGHSRVGNSNAGPLGFRRWSGCCSETNIEDPELGRKAAAACGATLATFEGLQRARWWLVIVAIVFTVSRSFRLLSGDTDILSWIGLGISGVVMISFFVVLPRSIAHQKQQLLDTARINGWSI